MAGILNAPFGPLLPRVQIRSRRFVLYNSSHPETLPSGAAASGVEAKFRRPFACHARAERQITDQNKSPMLSHEACCLLMPGSVLLSHGEPHAPSALRRFTSEFGMGSGWDHRAIAVRQILFHSNRLTSMKPSEPISELR